MPLEFHPAADAFPLMDGKRFAELKADIAAHGQREEITRCEGMILDGRNRYLACTELGVEPKFRDYTGDPWSYAWSLNGERRDLVAEQRYLIWKHCSENSQTWQAEQKRIRDEANRKISNAIKHRPRNDDGTLAAAEPEPPHSVAVLVDVDDPEAAESEHPTAEAKATASKTNRGAVERGDTLATRRPDLAEAVRKGDMKPAEAHRQMKRDEVKDKVAALPADKFRVVYADPPWSYNDKQSGSISDSYGAAEKHYPSMSMSELKALDVQSLVAPDSVLFLWATSPLLPDAIELARAWGFTYKASFVWDKVKHNMGHYNSVRHEFLLVCTRGSCTPENVKLFDSVQSIERTDRHSEKPEEFRSIIETLYPSGSRIELFRRGDRPNGWQVWGNEA